MTTYAHIFAVVRRRLIEAEAWEELRHLHRLSDDEVDLLVARELAEVGAIREPHPSLFEEVA